MSKLISPIEAVVFDCDGTLSAIEGIDELARLNNVANQVTALTKNAMSQGALSVELYDKRLKLTNCLQSDIKKISKLYIAHMTKDINYVIATLKKLNKAIYIVSAGLKPAILPLAATLFIPREHVYAVDIYFDVHGQYQDFERTSPLCNNAGKRQIIQALRQRHQTIAHIGDGANDLACIDLVDRFIGFGGNIYFESIQNACEFYITSSSMGAVLPLILTEEEQTLI